MLNTSPKAAAKYSKPLFYINVPFYYLPNVPHMFTVAE